MAIVAGSEPGLYNLAMGQLSNNEHTVFRGRRIELRIVEVPAGNGRTASRELVIHPGAAVILAFTDADEAVMIQNK